MSLPSPSGSGTGVSPVAERDGHATACHSRNAVSAELHHLGNREIMDMPLTAFFCSVRCPGNLILKAYDLAQKWRDENRPVIGGFHSPVEREVLRILLRSTVPVCIVLARSLPKRIPPDFRRTGEGRRPAAFA